MKATTTKPATKRSATKKPAAKKAKAANKTKAAKPTATNTYATVEAAVKVYRPKARLHRERATERANAFDEYAVAPKVRVTPWVQAGAGGLVVAGEL